MNTIIHIRRAQAIEKRFRTRDMDRHLTPAGIGHLPAETIEMAQAKPASDQSKKMDLKTNTAGSDQSESRSLVNCQDDNPADLKQANKKP